MNKSTISYFDSLRRKPGFLSTWFAAKALGVLFLIGGFLLAPAVCPAAEETPTYLFETSYSYSEGNYGTNVETSFHYVPLTLTRFFSWGEAYGTLPFVTVEGDSSVWVVSGSPNRTRRTTLQERETEESGVGDIYLGSRLYLINESPTVPRADLHTYLKVPTADEDKGLGTGEFDAGLGLELSKEFVYRHFGFFNLGYAFVGDYRDQWNYLLGYGYQFLPDLFGSLSYQERRSLVKGDENPKDLTFSGRYQFTPLVFGTGALGFGLSDGSPDEFISIGGGVYF